MPINQYTETNLIEQPAIELFGFLGYSHVNCYNETFGEIGTLGRETCMGSDTKIERAELTKNICSVHP